MHGERKKLEPDQNRTTFEPWQTEKVGSGARVCNEMQRKFSFVCGKAKVWKGGQEKGGKEDDDDEQNSQLHLFGSIFSAFVKPGRRRLKSKWKRKWEGNSTMAPLFCPKNWVNPRKRKRRRFHLSVRSAFHFNRSCLFRIVITAKQVEEPAHKRLPKLFESRAASHLAWQTWWWIDWFQMKGEALGWLESIVRRDGCSTIRTRNSSHSPAVQVLDSPWSSNLAGVWAWHTHTGTATLCNHFELS